MRRLVLALAMLSACSTLPTQETLTDAGGNVTYCASEAVIESFINTTLIHACTPTNPKTVVTFVSGNSVGGALLNMGNAAVAAAPVAAAVLK